MKRDLTQSARAAAPGRPKQGPIPSRDRSTYPSVEGQT
jgi:hypothetical protein